MEELKCRFPDEYIVGKIYYIQDTHDATKFLITLCEGKADTDRINGRYLTNMLDNSYSFATGTTTPYVINRPSRLATHEEKIWYMACIAADKYISREDALAMPKSKRVIPTEKSYIITEEQLKTLHDCETGNFIRMMLEKWYNPEIFHEKVGGNG